MLLGGTLLGCTVTPDFFPDCVNPYVDTCPVGDASADGGDGGDGGEEAAPDATAAAPDVTAPAADVSDAGVADEAGQVTMQ